MTATATQIEIEALPKQIEFLKAKERELLYSGAFGAGKSRALCIMLVMRASRPGAREGLCRKELVTLKATTLKTLLEPDGDLPPVLPQGSYSHNKSEKIIRLYGGGEIQYFGLDKDSKIGSYNLTGCGVDEAVELTEQDWRQLRGRIRVKVEGLSNQLYGACNPGVPSHFLAERFGLANGFQPKANCRAIKTRSTDNHFLPPDYIEDLLSFQGIAKKRYVDGEWVGSEGLIYGDQWDRSIFVQERRGPWDRIIVCQDEGYTNPSVQLVLCMDNDGRLHIASEWYERKKLESEVVAQAVETSKKHDIEAYVVDPSAAKLIAAQRASGLNVVEANNAVFDGIRAVQDRFVVADDGRPRITIDPSCTRTIAEVESYEWKKDRAGNMLDEPVKTNDHAMDGLRYGVVYYDGVPQMQFSVVESTPDREQDDDWSDDGWERIN